jgi:uncharacterized iron-regulated membrane protein
MKKYIKKNIYKWHKIIGLITIIPVIFWCISGLMHPFLAHWFKPKIAKEIFIPKPLKKEQMSFSVKQVLEKNNINALKNFRVVQFKGATYYQIKNAKNDWLYFDTQSGKELVDGDKKYAEYLARYFLADSTSEINSITKLTDFSQQYKYINRLLPIWKVSFERADKMDVYVETPYSRLGTFNPTSRKIFLWIFDNFHNWAFLEIITNNTLRITIMILFLSIICISSLSGVIIYGFMWRKFKKPKPNNRKGMLRKYHRQIGISVAFVSLTFAFSGAYHATRKLEPSILSEMLYEPILETSELPDSLPFKVIGKEKIINLSFVKNDTAIFHQIVLESEKGKVKKIIYINTKNNQQLENGNFKYAIFLATIFKQNYDEKIEGNCCETETDLNKCENTNEGILKTEEVISFETREYGFAFKRLPVVRVSYKSPKKTNLYIETTTSRLAAKIENEDRYEGYTFAILHKFLFLDWAGKNVRDIAMMLSALGVLTISVLGCVLYFKS